MKDYTRYSMTFRVDRWTRIPVRDEWLHPNHIFGMRFTLSNEVAEWLDKNVKGHYARIEDEEFYVNHTIAFSREADAAWFLMRWS